jgi:phthalate 4,5-dioxygenase
MLSAEDNEILTRVGPGTPMGREPPPALSGSGDFRSIRGAEKVLASGEDWRVLGTDDDPLVQEGLKKTLQD